MVVTNDLKKGDKVHLRNGWDAKIEDNIKGVTRLATVYGDETEMGSIYSHDIQYLFADSRDAPIEEARAFTRIGIDHTDDQTKLRQRIADFGY